MIIIIMTKNTITIIMKIIIIKIRKIVLMIMVMKQQ